MSRPSLKSKRRAQLARAFAEVLAEHGQRGATIVATAERAGVTPGLVHHYFRDKQDLYDELLSQLAGGLRWRLDARIVTEGPNAFLASYVDAALARDERSDPVAARAWVGVFGEALTDSQLLERVRRLLDAEIRHIERRAKLSTPDASAVLTFIIGALVFGAFAPRKTAGFAAPALHRMIAGLLATLSPPRRGPST